MIANPHRIFIEYSPNFLWMTCWNNFFHSPASFQRFVPTPAAISGQQRSNSSVWRKSRNTATRWVYTSEPDMVRATGVCVLAAATRRKTSEGQGTFRPTQNDNLIQIHSNTEDNFPPKKNLLEELQKNIFNHLFFFQWLFQKKIPTPPKTAQGLFSTGGPVPLAKHRLRSNPKPQHRRGSCRGGVSCGVGHGAGGSGCLRVQGLLGIVRSW